MRVCVSLVSLRIIYRKYKITYSQSHTHTSHTHHVYIAHTHTHRFKALNDSFGVDFHHCKAVYAERPESEYSKIGVLCWELWYVVYVCACVCVCTKMTCCVFCEFLNTSLYTHTPQAPPVQEWLRASHHGRAIH
jgi:hypothetical protein